MAISSFKREYFVLKIDFVYCFQRIETVQLSDCSVFLIGFLNFIARKSVFLDDTCWVTDCVTDNVISVIFKTSE